MLVVNGDPLVSEDDDDLLGAILSNGHLSQATAAFLSDPHTLVPAQHRSLCILQVRHSKHAGGGAPRPSSASLGLCVLPRRVGGATSFIFILVTE